MLDDRVFDLLRRGAALAHAVPGARLSIDADGTPVLTVGAPFGPPSGVRACSPCGFRRAVIRAAGLHAAGHRLALTGLDGDEEISMRLDVGPTGEVLDGDLVLARISDRVVALAATTLDPAAAGHAMRAVGIDAADLAAHHDAELGATLLHVDVTLDDAERSRRSVDLLVRARDACAVAELIEGLSPAGVQ